MYPTRSLTRPSFVTHARDPSQGMDGVIVKFFARKSDDPGFSIPSWPTHARLPRLSRPFVGATSRKNGRAPRWRVRPQERT